MKVRAIDFVELGVADMDRALRFYRDTLGMDFPLSGGGDDWKELDLPAGGPRASTRMARRRASWCWRWRWTTSTPPWRSCGPRA